MLNYKWPGNVRELRNVIERAVLVTDRDRLELDFSDKTEQLTADNPFSDLPTLDELQRRYIRFVLKHTSGQIGGKGGAAEILNMKRTSVNSRMKQLGMR
jgi:DNA-binding NtrC family response regulator